MPSNPDAQRAWSAAELAALGGAELVHVAVARADGSLRDPVVVGHVRVDGDELIRSMNGRGGSWFRGALASGEGELEVGGIRIRVAFVPDAGREAAVDDALRRRYGDDAGVRRMTSAPARDATMRVVPIG